MSSKNMIEIQWEFDVTTDEEIQRRLDLTEGEVYEILDEEDGAETLNERCCNLLDVPRYVDLDLFFDDPRSVSDDQILDAMSDEYGWLIQSFEWQTA